MWRHAFLWRRSVHSASLDLTTANNELKWTRKRDVVAWLKPVIQNFPGRTQVSRNTTGLHSRHLVSRPSFEPGISRTQIRNLTPWAQWRRVGWWTCTDVSEEGGAPTLKLWVPTTTLCLSTKQHGITAQKATILTFAVIRPLSQNVATFSTNSFIARSVSDSGSVRSVRSARHQRANKNNGQQHREVNFNETTETHQRLDL